MIFGIGVDVLQASRMRRTYQRFGQRLIRHLLLPRELEQLELTQRPERFLAMRFAAKEALVKAMGTGFAHGMWIRDVGVAQNAWGKPEVIYSPRGERMRRKLGIGDGHVTLTDEAGLIVAVAVLMRATGGKRAARNATGKTVRKAVRKAAPRRAKLRSAKRGRS